LLVTPSGWHGQQHACIGALETDEYLPLGVKRTRRREVLWLDPAGAEEGVKIGGVETDVSAQLEVRDAALGHQPADEPRAHTQALGCFWDTQRSLHAEPLSLVQTNGNECRQE
jgi:hypothetical protein